jgi:uncharacterized membrane-anchored protein
MNEAPSEVDARLVNKVPAVTVTFWVIKIMATTVGETAADFLNVDLHLGLAGTSVIMGAILAIALLVQLRARKYVPWIYWATVLLVSVFGTLVTDNLVDNLGVSLETTSAVFSLALIATFAAWYAMERTLSIQTICTTRRELFYWTAILFTFALGTAAGDLSAEGMHLGYAASAAIFGAAIALVAVAHFALKFDVVAAFWIAYVLTRPLGASIADFLSQSRVEGGLGLGATGTSAAFLAIIVALVVWLTRRGRRDVPLAGRR